MIPWNPANAFEQRERSDLAHRRRLRQRLNHTWDMLQARQFAKFERGLARPPLPPNGPTPKEDAPT